MPLARSRAEPPNPALTPPAEAEAKGARALGTPDLVPLRRGIASVSRGRRRQHTEHEDDQATIVQAPRPGADGEDRRELHGGARACCCARTRSPSLCWRPPTRRSASAPAAAGRSGSTRSTSGARRRASHREIARWVAEQQGGIHPLAWNAQAVAHSYERARGLRAVGEHADGFTVTASKTVAVGVERLYDAFLEAARRIGLTRAHRDAARSRPVSTGPTARAASTRRSPPRARRRAPSRSRTRGSADGDRARADEGVVAASGSRAGASCDARRAAATVAAFLIGSVWYSVFGARAAPRRRRRGRSAVELLRCLTLALVLASAGVARPTIDDARRAASCSASCCGSASRSFLWVGAMIWERTPWRLAADPRRRLAGQTARAQRDR